MATHHSPKDPMPTLVFKARHCHTDETIAVNAFRVDDGEKPDLHMFSREADFLADLRFWDGEGHLGGVAGRGGRGHTSLRQSRRCGGAPPLEAAVAQHEPAPLYPPVAPATQGACSSPSSMCSSPPILQSLLACTHAAAANPALAAAELTKIHAAASDAAGPAERVVCYFADADFDSNGWMESLIGDAPVFSDSDLDRLIFTIPPPPAAVQPKLAPLYPPAAPAMQAACSSPSSMCSSPPILQSLLACARATAADPVLTANRCCDPLRRAAVAPFNCLGRDRR